VQLSFATSVEPIVPLEISITRMAATNEAEKNKKSEGADDERSDNRTMGRKHIVPYGLYRAHGFVSAKLAERTGFGDDDLSFLWEALKNAFEHDRSAARGEMAARKLIVFQHDCALGNAPAQNCSTGSGSAATPRANSARWMMSASTICRRRAVTAITSLKSTATTCPPVSRFSTCCDRGTADGRA